MKDPKDVRKKTRTPKERELAAARDREKEREREREKEREKGPSADMRKKWAALNEAGKLQWLSSCDNRCVSALKNTKSRGEPLTTAGLDYCFEKCAAKK